MVRTHAGWDKTVKAAMDAVRSCSSIVQVPVDRIVRGGAMLSLPSINVAISPITPEDGRDESGVQQSLVVAVDVFVSVAIGGNEEETVDAAVLIAAAIGPKLAESGFMPKGIALVQQYDTNGTLVNTDRVQVVVQSNGRWRP